MKASKVQVGDCFDWFGERATVLGAVPSRFGGPYATDFYVELEHHERLVLTFPWRHEVVVYG